MSCTFHTTIYRVPNLAAKPKYRNERTHKTSNVPKHTRATLNLLHPYECPDMKFTVARDDRGDTY